MSEPASISSGIAKRYATAIFELAMEPHFGNSATEKMGRRKHCDALLADVTALENALTESADLRRLITSPVYSRDQVTNAISAVAARMGLSQTVAGALGLMAQKRRLFALPQVLASLRAQIAAEKGEVTADVTSATALSPAQEADLVAMLKERIGKEINLKLAVDETLIGGLVIKVGSQMIDTSIRAKLAALKNSMKEVG